jgi:A/G-specific adenine glycosylase
MPRRAAPKQSAHQPSRRRLLAWYDRHRRTMPWRAEQGETPDPYRIWLSEIMLQQTTVATVGPYFTAFLKRWPSVETLALASLDDVLHAWQGLGFYARARNLHACARVVATKFGGRFPQGEQDLLSLPGVGVYTAAAIGAIAFGRNTVPVDGNVVRVLTRSMAIETPLPAARGAVAAIAADLAAGSRPGDFAQALMDLGATVCTPKAPDCERCPWSSDCRGLALGIAATLPRPAAKTIKPRRYGVAFWAIRDDGAVFLRRRPEKGLLGGMMEIPTSAWRDRPWPADEALAAAPFPAAWQPHPGSVRHTFTHFHLELALVTAEFPVTTMLDSGIWCRPNQLSDQALPTLMKKIVHLAAP